VAHSADRKLSDPIAKEQARVVSSSQPHRLLVANAKGGSGKTTITTNIGCYLASKDFHVAIIDHDPQGSSSQWVKERNETLPTIDCVEAFKKNDGHSTRSFQLKVPVETDFIISDTPAGINGVDLSEHIRHCDAILIPIVPSAIDIRAATSFIKDVLLCPGFRRKPKPIAVIANRVKRNTVGYSKLEIFLRSLNIPFVATIRDTQRYVRAAEVGMGIYDFSNPNADDMKEWQPLIQWLHVQLQNSEKN